MKEPYLSKTVKLRSSAHQAITITQLYIAAFAVQLAFISLNSGRTSVLHVLETPARTSMAPPVPPSAR
ncbi:hypothetical protein AB205_0081750, partial [Aquarana catesbeiana]